MAAPRVAGQDVITWLHSPDGEDWSRSRVTQRLVYHHVDSGIFGDVIPDLAGATGSAARWTPAAGWTIQPWLTRPA